MQITMLNMMAGTDFAASLDRHVELGIEVLDLKDNIFGQKIEDLTEAQAQDAARLIAARGLSVYCLSSQLGYRDLELGEAAWVAAATACLDNVLMVARILKPAVVRLLVASSPGSAGLGFPEVVARHPWLVPAYRKLTATIAAAGFRPMVENEAHHCVVTSPEDAVAFVAATRGDTELGFIWDVQNMWQMGTFPSLAGLDTLRPILTGIHLKGGIAGSDGDLETASGLAEASWPVRDIVGAVIESGLVDVVCLNPSHGARRPGYSMAETAAADIRFLRAEFSQLTAPRR